jgi:branched-chain amino acid transport system permease protein
MAARFQFVQGTPQYRAYKWGGWALFVLFVFLVVFAYADTGQVEILGNGYTVSLSRLSKAVAFMVGVLGLQVIVGFTGQLALGQSFFFGTGAYVSAYLVADQNWSWVASLLIVIPVCFLIGMIFGLPALRIRGLYLALVTLGLAAIFPAIVQLDEFEIGPWTIPSLAQYTGGAGGKTVSSELVPPSWVPLDGIASFLQGIPLIGQYFGDGDLSSREADRIWAFFLFAVLAGVAFWLIANMLKSRPGRAIRAIRDNETSAAVSGVNLTITKTLSFGIASALGGVGGMIYVAELGIASPGDFTQLLAINFIVGLVVGGVGTLSGAVVGGLVIAFVPDWASETSEFPGIPERWLQGPTGTLILGLLLILLTFFLPGGIVAGTRKLKARLVSIVPRPPQGVAAGAPTTADDGGGPSTDGPTPDDRAAPATVSDVGESDTATSSPQRERQSTEGDSEYDSARSPGS